MSSFFIYLELSNFNDTYAGNAGKLYYSDFKSKNKEETDNRMLFEEINYSYKSVSLSKSNLISIYQYTKNKIKVLNYSRICYISQDAGREQKEKLDKAFLRSDRSDLHVSALHVSISTFLAIFLISFQIKSF